MAKKPVRSPGDADGVPNEGIAEEQTGVSGAEGASPSKTQQGDSQSRGSDRVAELEQRMESLQQEAERNIARLQSSADKRTSQLQSTVNQLNEQLQQTRRELREERMKDMPESERTQFELQTMKQEMSRMQQELQQKDSLLERVKVAQEWADRAIEAGVDPSAINREAEPEDILNSVWNGMLQTTANLKKELKTLKAGDAGPNNQIVREGEEQQVEDEELTPPDVLTGARGKVKQGRTMADVVKSLNDQNYNGRSNWSMADIYDLHSKGKIPQEVMNEIIESRALAATAE